MPEGIFGPDFLKDLFGEEPRLGFFGALQNQNFSPIQRQFFQTQFEPFQNRFFGSSANLLQGGTALGELPSFEDFLGGVNFNQEFGALPPSLRPGGGTARFAPPTRFQF